MSSNSLNLNVHETTRDHIIASWSNLLMTVYRGETTLPSVLRTQQIHEQNGIRNPHGLCLMMVVESGAPMPSSEVRKALSAALSDAAGRTLMSAVVHEGTGFHAAAVRSVVTGLAMLSRPPYPHRVYATVREAAIWIGGNPKSEMTANEIARAVQQACDTHRAWSDSPRAFGRTASL